MAHRVSPAQLLMHAALEAEVAEFLGRDRYQRTASCEGARPGSRNGYRGVAVKTTAGPVALSRPKLRGATEVFASRLFGSRRGMPMMAGSRTTLRTHMKSIDRKLGTANRRQAVRRARDLGLL